MKQMRRLLLITTLCLIVVAAFIMSAGLPDGTAMILAKNGPVTTRFWEDPVRPKESRLTFDTNVTNVDPRRTVIYADLLRDGWIEQSSWKRWLSLSNKGAPNDYVDFWWTNGQIHITYFRAPTLAERLLHRLKASLGIDDAWKEKRWPRGPYRID